jgi:hypothetical protein
MAAEGDLAFGRIAVELGFCAEDHVKLCLDLQAKAADGRSLGHHMQREGFLNEEQHSQVLRRQRELLAARPKVTNDDRLFGRLAVREGIASQEQIDQAVREQAGTRKGLGDILREKGILSAAEVEWLLGLQSKWIMRCPSCSGTFTVHSSSKNPSKANCPRCRVPLEAKPAPATTSAEAEVDTSVRLKPPPRGGAPARSCDHPFIGEPEPDEQVECLSCRTRFTPNR